MGKKNRRRDETKRADETQKLLASKVDAIEAADPTYRNMGLASTQQPDAPRSFVRMYRTNNTLLRREIPQPNKHGPPRVRPPDRRPRRKVRVQFCSSSHLDRNRET